jgi:hypothetical protein
MLLTLQMKKKMVSAFSRKENSEKKIIWKCWKRNFAFHKSSFLFAWFQLIECIWKFRFHFFSVKEAKKVKFQVIINYFQKFGFCRNIFLCLQSLVRLLYISKHNMFNFFSQVFVAKNPSLGTFFNTPLTVSLIAAIFITG